MKVTVTQGQVHVNSVWVFAQREDAIILYADTRAKYPKILAISGEMVYLCADGETLHAEPTDAPTTIALYGETFADGSWQLDATTSRYEVYIYAYKIPEEPVELWNGDERE